MSADTTKETIANLLKQLTQERATQRHAADRVEYLATENARLRDYISQSVTPQGTGVKMQNVMVGKRVIVRASVAGVHTGTVESINVAEHTVVLTQVRRLWRVYTRDASGSISDVAANGLKDGAKHSIGAELVRVCIINPAGFEIAEMTDAAYASVFTYPVA